VTSRSWSRTNFPVEQIKLVRSESQVNHEFTIIWVPRRTLVSNAILEEHGVLGDAVISELFLHFVPLEQDLLSLELDTSFSELYLRKDPTSIFASARALMLLQKQYGLFPRMLGKGDDAKRLIDLLQRMRSEEDVETSSGSNSQYLGSFSLTPSALIEHLVVIDRSIDFPTALATQLTYEGLIDEVFTISNNTAEVESSILDGASSAAAQASESAATPTSATKRKILLDNTDKLYPELRNGNFATVGPALNRAARRLASDNESMHNKDQSVADLKNIVQKLPAYQAETASVKIHTSLAGQIMETTRGDGFGRMLEVQQNLLAGTDPTSLHENIEELIARGFPIETVLRLLCIESCLSNGIRQRELDLFKRHVLQAYGYPHTLTLANLEKMGLLITRESHRGYLNPIAGSTGQTATDYAGVRKGLHLWVDEVRETDPDDVAYVFSGYAPLTVRLVQALLQKSYLQNIISGARTATAPVATAPTGTGWKGFDDAVSRIRGATVDVSQRGSDADAAHARKTLRGSKEGPKVTIVFFLGGITYAEIAALRFISKQLEESMGRSILIATTGIVSGKRIIDGALEKRKFGDDE
jgi:hypothetical protein